MSDHIGPELAAEAARCARRHFAAACEAWARALDWLEDAVFPPPAGLRPRRRRR